MKYRTILAVLLISIIVFVFFWRLEPVSNPSKPNFFVGVDTAYDNVEDMLMKSSNTRIFLGFYIADEFGGRQIDGSYFAVPVADNYTDAANKYVRA